MQECGFQRRCSTWLLVTSSSLSFLFFLFFFGLFYFSPEILVGLSERRAIRYDSDQPWRRE